MELKSLHKSSVASAFEKAKHYRLLNDPENAESICLDILKVVPDHQEATEVLILALADQFDGGSQQVKQAQTYLNQLKNEFQRTYFAGLICERAARATLVTATPFSRSTAYGWFNDAMDHFAKAEALSPAGNNDAILRWNSCARSIQKHKLKPRADDNFVAYGD